MRSAMFAKGTPAMRRCAPKECRKAWTVAAAGVMFAFRQIFFSFGRRWNSCPPSRFPATHRSLLRSAYSSTSTVRSPSDSGMTRSSASVRQKLFAWMRMTPRSKRTSLHSKFSISPRRMPERRRIEKIRRSQGGHAAKKADSSSEVINFGSERFPGRRKRSTFSVRRGEEEIPLHRPDKERAERLQLVVDGLFRNDPREPLPASQPYFALSLRSGASGAAASFARSFSSDSLIGREGSLRFGDLSLKPSALVFLDVVRLHIAEHDHLRVELPHVAVGEGREHPRIAAERRRRAVDREVLPILFDGAVERHPLRSLTVEGELALEAGKRRFRLLLAVPGDEAHPVRRLAVRQLPYHLPATEPLPVNRSHPLLL